MNYRIKNILTKKEDLIEKNFWDKYETDNKIIFPEDYKWFLDYYGVGSINDFLWILSPFCNNMNLNSVEQYKLMKNSYELMKNSHLIKYKYVFYNNGMGLFPWGITDNGDELYWNYLKDGMEIVIIAARYTDIISYNMNINDFLCRILTKEIECAIFPDDFVVNNNYFVPFLK